MIRPRWVDLCDVMSPDERDLPPSTRTWARVVRLVGGFEIVELRDPNSGLGDAASKPRHQYLVHDDRLWSRVLPPRDLDDATRDAQTIAAAPWSLVEPSRGLIWQHAGLRPYAVGRPRLVSGEWDLHGDGDCATEGYEMPARNPWDMWAAVTDAPCPICEQTLVWAEAGAVPGYRICMARRADGYAPSTARHHWLWWRGVLVHDERCDGSTSDHGDGEACE